MGHRTIRSTHTTTTLTQPRRPNSPIRSQATGSARALSFLLTRDRPLERGKRRRCSPCVKLAARPIDSLEMLQPCEPRDRRGRSGCRWCGCAPCGRAHAAVFKIGTIVSYRGRLHVVIGVTPMSVTPQVVEIEDRESGRIRRVPSGDLQLFKEPEKSPREDDREGDL